MPFFLLFNMHVLRPSSKVCEVLSLYFDFPPLFMYTSTGFMISTGMMSQDGSSGEDFSKDSIVRDERRLTELGRRTIEIFVLAHIFR